MPQGRVLHLMYSGRGSIGQYYPVPLPSKIYLPQQNYRGLTVMYANYVYVVLNFLIIVTYDLIKLLINRTLVLQPLYVVLSLSRENFRLVIGDT